MAPFLGHLARRLAKALHLIGSCFSRLANLLEGLLPALLPPAEHSRLTCEQYLTDYHTYHLNAIDPASLYSEEEALDVWERQVFDRYGLRTGRMLVMGAGTGREAIEIARRGLSVVGIDSNFAALGIARRLAGSRGLPIQVNQGDYMALPYASDSFDYALLSCSMYSSIPGRAGRQAWLQELARILPPGGLVMLSFLPERDAPGRVRGLCRRLNLVLVKLPGANATYQRGDEYTCGHFVHAFQNEDEARGELDDAGVRILELDWKRGYAVVAFPPAPALTQRAPRPAQERAVRPGCHKNI